MSIDANIEPLTWENQFFGVNSAIVRFADDAPLLTAERLAGWSRVQAKIAAHQVAQLDALQALGFQLVEGEVDLALPVTPVACPKPLSCALVRSRRQRPLLCSVDRKRGQRHV